MSDLNIKRLILLICIFISACASAQAYPTESPATDLTDVTAAEVQTPFHVVIDPNLRELEPLIRDVAQKQGIDEIEFEWLGGQAFKLKAASYCKDDKKDVNLWIASNQIYMPCSKLVSSTTQLGRSVTTLAVMEDVANNLGWTDQPSFAQVMKASSENQLSLAMASPVNDGAALQGVTNAFSAVLPEPRTLMITDVVSVNQNDQAAKNIASVELFMQSLTMTAFDANDLASRIVANRQSAQPTVNAFYGSEIIALRINHQLLLAGLPQYHLFYIRDATGLETYPMGCSNGNSDLKKEQCSKLLGGLTKDDAVKAMLTEQFGFRTGSEEGHYLHNPSQAALAYFRPNEWGTVIDHNLVITLPPKLPVIEAVGKVYLSIKPGAFTVYLLDVSGSQEGVGLYTSKTALSAMFNRLTSEGYGTQASENDTTFLVFFDHTIKAVYGPIYGEDLSSLEVVTSGLTDEYVQNGGTNIAGGAAFGIELVKKYIKPGQIPSVIGLTDGDQRCQAQDTDCNSSQVVEGELVKAAIGENGDEIRSYDQFSVYIEGLSIQVPVYFIATGTAKVEDMQEKARWTNGSVCDARPSDEVLYNSANLYSPEEQMKLILDPLAQCFINFKGNN